MHTGVQRKNVSRLTDAWCADRERCSLPDERRGPGEPLVRPVLTAKEQRR